MLRSKLGLFTILTVVFLGGVALLYGARTGALTIFGDASSLAASVTIDKPVDLTKGVRAGNGNLVVVENGLELKPETSTRPGTCQFDIGNPEVTSLQRFHSLKSLPQPEGTSITVQFAGSLDGISFGALSTPTQLDPDPAIPDTVDLATVVAPGSHYVRVVCTLTGSVPGTTPHFDGFTIDYEVLGDIPAPSGSLDVSADQATALTAVSVNGTQVGSTSTDVGNDARRASTTTLAGTGVDTWLVALIGLWVLGTLVIVSHQPQLSLVGGTRPVVHSSSDQAIHSPSVTGRVKKR